MIARTIFLFLFLFLFSPLGWSLPKYKVTSWGNTDVIWVQDDNFPRFNLNVYFSDGGLGDDSSKAGTTDLMMKLLLKGTKTKTQAEIADEMDDLALSIDTQTGYESSGVFMKGLMKEIKPSIDLFCHILNEATFPEQEIENSIARLKSKLNNLSASPSAVAERALGIYTYSGTPFEQPLSGRIVSLKNITREDIKSRWDFLKTQMRKRIYLAGPKSLLDIEDYFMKKCSFFAEGKNERVSMVPATSLTSEQGKVIFVKIPNANQVQIRYSAAINPKLFQGNYDLATFGSGILGSGFTSLLMQEVRVKKGYTYGVSSYASPRILSGLSVISTFTKNQTFLETVFSIDSVLSNAQLGFNDAEKLEMTKKFLTGKQMLQFEDSSTMLNTFVNYDHLGRKYSEITAFPEVIKKISFDDVKKSLKTFFPVEEKKYNWIFVGDESLVAKAKERWGAKLIILDYKDIL